MVYVGPDGRIYDQRPWNMQRFFGLFTGLFAILVAFFRTLCDPLLNAGNKFNNRRGPGGGDAGGGNDYFRRGPPPPGGRRGRIGRIATFSDCNIPGGG